MPPLLISQVALAAGVSADTLRFYERKGVLPPPARSPAGYRVYSPSAVERVRVVRRAMAVGFTLDELARVLRARDKGGVPCREVRAIAARKLEEIEERLRALRAVKRDLKGALEDWDARLARTPSGQQARLLDTLHPAHAVGPRRRENVGPQGTRK
jgi:DNA-binding transcriptional MerR regulator